MKLRGEKELKAEELYSLLSNEVVMSFSEYLGVIKGSNLEDINDRDDLIELIEEQQPVKYCVFVGLLNADLDLKTIKTLISIERTHGNLIDSLYKRLNTVKDRVNIFNEHEVEKFVSDSVYLLSVYYDMKETESNND